MKNEIIVGIKHLKGMFVKGHTKKNGKTVHPHYRSVGGDYKTNWSTRGNTNPVTGREGFASLSFAKHFQERRRNQ